MKHLKSYQLFEADSETEKTTISGGKLLLCKNKTAPLLVVYGGINVNGRASGDYMWDYVDKLKSRYHIFVATSHRVDGSSSYLNLLTQLEKYGIKPSTRVLYLFSGGYRPGMAILKNKASDFSKVILVDIWMKGSVISEFYTRFTKENKSKVKYYYTDFGANNTVARDTIAKGASTAKRRAGRSMTDHMNTNVDAVNSL